ncbi:hypothetical protein SDC9_123191 [bioreactor metagenome]|uniref:Uncharacterized protein n=1 Tax=bioreactor metagenome TaxID=1076179 RepID=A0A645CH32_9ZZZZ
MRSCGRMVHSLVMVWSASSFASHSSRDGLSYRNASKSWLFKREQTLFNWRVSISSRLICAWSRPQRPGNISSKSSLEMSPMTCIWGSGFKPWKFAFPATRSKVPKNALTWADASNCCSLHCLMDIPYGSCRRLCKGSSHELRRSFMKGFG